jgi:hypothetical protein
MKQVVMEVKMKAWYHCQPMETGMLLLNTNFSANRAIEDEL